MRKKSLILALFFVATLCGGCSGGKVSNDVLEIKQYKDIQVEIPSNLEDTEEVAQYEDKIWQELMKQCEVKTFPQEELDALVQELQTQYSYASYYDGMTADELIEEVHGMTAIELAKEQLTKRYAVELIAKEEGLELSDAEYQTELKKRAESGGIDSPKEYESMFGYDELYQIFLEERVMEFLKNNIKE